ncbi:hypothetical protein AVEN_60035-1 [Araneus ventricosus]|nr:hypothetical protein AVEN_60035-1 [Araneus ventricosus]
MLKVLAEISLFPPFHIQKLNIQLSQKFRARISIVHLRMSQSTGRTMLEETATVKNSLKVSAFLPNCDSPLIRMTKIIDGFRGETTDTAEYLSREKLCWQRRGKFITVRSALIRHPGKPINYKAPDV